MLHCKTGKFNQFGVSFALPSEFFFDSCDDEHLFENGIRVLSGNRDYAMQFAIHRNCKSTAEELEQLWDAGSATPLSGLEKIRHNGLSGHQAYYSYQDGMQYFEMRLSLPDDMQFSLMIETEEKDILELVKSEDIQRLIQEIQAA